MSGILLVVQDGGGGGGYGQFLILGLMVLVFYFFMIRPQQRRQREHRRYIAQVKKGDQVVTSGGIHGKVLSVSQDTLVLDIDKGVRLTIDKSSLSYEGHRRAQTAQGK